MSAVGFQKAASLCCNPFVLCCSQIPWLHPCACLSPLHSDHAWVSISISPLCLDFASPDGEELQANNIPLPVCTDNLRNSSPCTPLQPMSTSLGLGEGKTAPPAVPSCTPCATQPSTLHQQGSSGDESDPRGVSEHLLLLDCSMFKATKHAGPGVQSNLETYPARGFEELKPLNHCPALRSSNRTLLVQCISDLLLYIPQPRFLCPKLQRSHPSCILSPFLRPNISQQMPGRGAAPEIRLQC